MPIMGDFYLKEFSFPVQQLAVTISVGQLHPVGNVAVDNYWPLNHDCPVRERPSKFEDDEIGGQRFAVTPDFIVKLIFPHHWPHGLQIKLF